MKIIITLVCSFGISLTAFAQKSIQDISELSDKKFEKFVNTSNNAVVVKMYKKLAQKQADLTFPDSVMSDVKRIGLLSFFTADNSVRNPKALKRGGEYESFLSTDGGKKILETFYNESLKTLKNQFYEVGIELLTPVEFLTEETVEIYTNFEVTTSALGTGALKAANYLQGEEEKSIVAATGYRVFPAATILGGTDPKVIKSMAELTKKLGLDALLCVQIVTQKEKEDVGISAIRITLHGPNPIPDHPKMKYGMGKYTEGLLIEYAGTEINPPINFATISKKTKQFTAMETDYFDEVISRYIKLLIKNFKEDYVFEK
jgi:hypothetical protein